MVEGHQGWALEQAALWREKRRGVAVAGVGEAATRLEGVCGGTAVVRNPQCFLWSGCHGNGFEQISGQIGGHVGRPDLTGKPPFCPH